MVFMRIYQIKNHTQQPKGVSYYCFTQKLFTFSGGKILKVLILNVKLIVVLGLFGVVPAEQINSIVEFFSYKCSHCASVNSVLDQYVNSHKVNFFAVNVDNTEEAVNVNVAYYIAVDAGIGQQFKSTYFAAIANGMQPYSAQTLSSVVDRVKNKKFELLLKDNNEKTRVKDKFKLATQLMNTYSVQVTPSFLINGSTLLEGEDFVRSLN